MARKTTSCGWGLVAIGWLLAAAPVRAQATEERVAFDAVVQLFAAKCTPCHVGADAEKGLRLEREWIYRTTVNVPAQGDRRTSRVAPNHPEASYLLRKLLPPDRGGYHGPRMPLHAAPLSELEMLVVRTWISSFPAELWGAVPDETPVAMEAAAQTARVMFHSSHLANLPTPDPLGEGVLEFRFLHRFRPAVTDAGSKNLWGLDGGANISLGLTYGITDQLEMGLRRTNVDRQLEWHSKVLWLQQGVHGAPLSLALQLAVARDGGDSSQQRRHLAATALVGRQFGERLSLLLAPGYATHTFTTAARNNGGTATIGLGALYRISNLAGLTFEWIPQTAGVKRRYQGASLGFSVSTTRHTFHLLLTNSAAAQTSQYAPGADLDWGDHQFRLGFNITRAFGLKSGRY